MDEEELVSRILEGDHRAFEEFVHRYKGVIYGTLRRFRQFSKEDVDDLFQDVFRRLLENDQYALRIFQGPSLSAYLRRITQNIARDELRKRKGKPIDPAPEDDEELIEIPDGNPGPEGEILLIQLRRMMVDAIDRLSPTDQRLIRLRFVEELSYSEIAGQLGIPIGNVGVQLMRAKDRLVAIIRNEFPALLAYLSNVL